MRLVKYHSTNFYYRFDSLTVWKWYQFNGVTLHIHNFSLSIHDFSELDPIYGLYSGFMGCFMYFIFGSCKDLNIGPTSILSLMIQMHVTNLGADMAVLTTFTTGCIIFLLGLFNLGECKLMNTEL